MCVILVTYNRLNLLKECLNYLLNQSIDVNHILVVNNKSTDGTSEYLNSLDNNRIIIKNMSENLGGAAGFSKGIKFAYKETKDDLFWIMDDDTFPSKNALQELLESDRYLKGNYGFLCSNVRWKDDSMTNIPQVSSDWGEKVDNELIGVSNATFVSILVPRIIVENVGIPTAELFIWGDDTEYTTRISSKYPCYFVSRSKVLHFTTNNLSNVTIANDSFGRVPRYMYMFRNLIYIDRKYYSRKKATKRFISIIMMVFSTIKNGNDHKFIRTMTIVKGAFRGLFFNPKIEYLQK